MNIPSFDATHQYESIAVEIEKNVRAVMAAGRYIMGPQVKEFEEQFAQYLNTKYVVSCNSEDRRVTSCS